MSKLVGMLHRELSGLELGFDYLVPPVPGVAGGGVVNEDDSHAVSVAQRVVAVGYVVFVDNHVRAYLPALAGQVVVHACHAPCDDEVGLQLLEYFIECLLRLNCTPKVGRGKN